MYGGDIFRQRKGMAVGTRVDPFYAIFFMGCFKEIFIEGNEEYQVKILLYKHFIDYLFLIWKGNAAAHLNSWGMGNKMYPHGGSKGDRIPGPLDYPRRRKDSHLL